MSLALLASLNEMRFLDSASMLTSKIPHAGWFVFAFSQIDHPGGRNLQSEKFTAACVAVLHPVGMVFNPGGDGRLRGHVP